MENFSSHTQFSDKATTSHFLTCSFLNNDHIVGSQMANKYSLSIYHHQRSQNAEGFCQIKLTWLTLESIVDQCFNEVCVLPSDFWEHTIQY